MKKKWMALMLVLAVLATAWLCALDTFALDDAGEAVQETVAGPAQEEETPSASESGSCAEKTAEPAPEEKTAEPAPEEKTEEQKAAEPMAEAAQPEAAKETEREEPDADSPDAEIASGEEPEPGEQGNEEPGEEAAENEPAENEPAEGTAEEEKEQTGCEDVTEQPQDEASVEEAAENREASDGETAQEEPSDDQQENVIPEEEPEADQPETADKEETASADETPAPETLKASLLADRSFAFAGEDTVYAELTVWGGLPEYDVSFSVQGEHESVKLSGSGSTSFAFAPKEYGQYTLTATVTDGSGQQAIQSVSIAVAQRCSEGESDWRRSVSGARLTGDWRRDLVAVAATQVGWRCDEKYFMMDDAGVKHVYSRYNAWYGAPYSDADWNAVFVSFCAHYAGIPEGVCPASASCRTWKSAMERQDAYRSAGSGYQPGQGDIVFFAQPGKSSPSHVGIVEKASGSTVHTLEGRDGCVSRRQYAVSGDGIIGYGSMEALMARAGKLTESADEQDGAAEAEDKQEITVIPMEQTTVGYTTGKNINVRSGPDKNTQRVTQIARKGTQVDVLGTVQTKDGLWYAVRYDGKEGFVSGRLLRLEVPEEPTEEPTAEPTEEPTVEPTVEPTEELTEEPTEEPTAEPTEEPTAEPTVEPTEEPTVEPTTEPVYFCNLDEHTHNADCFGPDGFICRLPEHVHTSDCLIQPTLPPMDIVMDEADEELAVAMLAEEDEEPAEESSVYTALDGAVTATATTPGQLTAQVIAEGNEEYDDYAELLEITAAERGESVLAMQLYDIAFAAEDGEAVPVEITLSLDAARFGGETLRAAHHGQAGWEWLDCTYGEADGAVVLRFVTSSFSPFAVAAVEPREAVALEDNTLPEPSLCGSGTTYDPLTDTFTTQVRIDFKFTTETGKPTAGTAYVYNYPAGIVVPDDIADKGAQTLYDGNTKAGTYQFINNGDGTYSVQIVFDQTYINESGDTITGYVQFEGSFSKEAMNEKGEIVVGTGDAVILVPAGEITYPADETESYNIDISKSGSWVQDGDKLVYTVYIRTRKGTPDLISFKDFITPSSGLTLGTPSVTVEKGTASYYYKSWDKTWGVTDNNDWSEVSGISSSYDNGTLTMSLPKLTGGTLDEYGNTVGEVYRITYTYPITGQTEAIVSADNTATATAKDNDKGQTVTASDSTTVRVDKDFSHTLEKNGQVASDKPGYIKWTVTVNRNKVDIAGATLSDLMLGLVENTSTDFSVEPSKNVAVTMGEGGRIASVTFTADESGYNTETYTLTYYTPVEDSWNGTTVSNTAVFDPTPDNPDDENKEVTSSVTVSGVQLNKWGQYNGTTKEITWTIVVNAGGLDIAGATLTDDMFAALSESDFTIDQTSGYEWIKDGDTITGMKFTAVDESGENRQTYTITYATAVTAKEDGTTSAVTNSATLSPGEGVVGTPIGSESTVKPDEIQLNKSGSFDGYTNNGSGYINWTIIVNSSRLNIAGAVLTDEMFSAKIGDITVTRENWDTNITGQYTISTDEEGKVSITFNATDTTDGNSMNTNWYTITYTTPASKQWESYVVSNEAKLTLEGTEIPASADVTVPADGAIAKSAGAAEQEGNTLLIPWTVTLTVPKGGLPAGTTIVDDVTRNQWGNTNTKQWMTRSQVCAWATNLTWKDDEGNEVGGTNNYNPPAKEVTFLASDGNTYTYKQISENERGFADNLTFTLFTITFPDGLIPPESATKLTFTYSTTADVSQAGTGKNSFYNYVEAGDKHDGAEYNYYTPGIDKTDGNGSSNTTSVSNEGELTWKIRVNVGSGNQTLMITDTLPKGVSLTGLHLTGWSSLSMELTIAEDGTISGTDSTNQYSVSGSYENNVATVTIVPQTEGGAIQTGAEFTLTVYAQVDDAASQSVSLTLTNTATATLDGKSIGDDRQTQNWSYYRNAVDKSGSWDNTNRIIEYTIILNPAGQTLLEDSDTLTLVDTMSYKNQVTLGWPFSGTYSITANLIQSSVKLYAASWNAEKNEWVAGTLITGWSWTYETKVGQDSWNSDQATNTITATGIPDGTPLMLKYSYRISSNVPDTIKVNGEDKQPSFDLKFTNKAVLEGTGHADESSSSSMKWEHSSQSAGVTTDKKPLVFYKVEKGNYNVSLAGAVFSVYAYDTANNVYGNTAVKTYTTDSNGTFQITFEEKDADGNVIFTYDTNTLYMVEETTPPKGYRKADNAQPYYFYFSIEDTTHTLPDTLPAGAVDLSTDSKTVYVENVKNTTEITVKKEWLDEGGNVETGSHAPITLELYRSTTKNSGSGDVTGNGIPYKVAYNDKTDTGTVENAGIGSTVKITTTVYWDSTYYQPTITALGVEGDGIWTHGNPGVYTYTGVITAEEIVVTINDNSNTNTNVKTILELVSQSSSGSSGGSGGTETTDDTKIGEEVTLSSSNDWTYTITALPLSAAGEDGSRIDYYYYFVEKDVPEGYSVSYSNGSSGVQEGTVTVTNQQQTIVTYTSATVRKAWQDVNGTAIVGSDASLPDSIQVYLLRTKDDTTERVDDSGNTGDAAQPYALTKEAGWTLTVDGLSTDYTYSFEEVAVEGYTSTITTAKDGATVITNKAQPDDTSLTVVKQWKDSSGNTLTSVPPSVTINLYQRATTQSGGESGGGGGTVTFSGSVVRSWDNKELCTIESSSHPVGTQVTIVLTDMWNDKADPVVNVNGQVQSATITTEEYTNQWGGTTTKKNYKYTFTIDQDSVFEAQIIWNSDVGDWEIEGPIFQEPQTGSSESGSSDATVISEERIKTIELNVGNNWSYTFTGLPLSGTDDGNTVTYTYYVVENPVSGYDTTYENNDGITSGTITVTNRKNTTETPSYELPETGSGGTSLYTMGGAALVALSLLFATCPRRRGERRVRH